MKHFGREMRMSETVAVDEYASMPRGKSTLHRTKPTTPVNRRGSATFFQTSTVYTSHCNQLTQGYNQNNQNAVGKGVIQDATVQHMPGSGRANET